MFNRFAAAVAVLALPAAVAGAAPDKAPRKGVPAKLKGAWALAYVGSSPDWAIVPGISVCRWTFKDDSVEWNVMPPLFTKKGKAAVTVDPSTTPHRITLTVGDRTYRGIYRFAKHDIFPDTGPETLDLLLCPPGAEPPKDFARGYRFPGSVKGALYRCQRVDRKK